MEGDGPAFPFALWKNIEPAAAGQCISYAHGRGMVACGVNDRVHLFRGEDDLGWLGGEKLQQDADDGGFASMIYDDVIQVVLPHSSSHIIALHRSGRVQVWRYEPAEEQKFAYVNSWLVTGGAVRLMEAHPQLPVVAITCTTGRTRVYDFVSGTLTHHFEGLLASGDQASVLRWHNTRALLMVGSNAGTVHVLDLYRQCIVAYCQAHASVVLDSAFLDVQLPLIYNDTNKQMQPCFITLGADRMLKLWSLKNVSDALWNRHAATIGFKSSTYNVVDFGSPLADFEKATPPTPEKKKKKNEDAEITRSLITQLLQGDASLYQLETTLASMTLKQDEAFQALMVVPGRAVKDALLINPTPGFVVVLGGETGQLCVVDLVSKTILEYQGQKRKECTFVAPHPPIRRLIKDIKNEGFAAETMNHGLVIWKLQDATIEPLKALQGVSVSTSAAVGFVSREGDNTYYVGYSCGIDGNIIEEKINWSSESRTAEVRELHLSAMGKDEVVAAVDLSPNKSRLAFVTRSGNIHVIDHVAGEIIATTKEAIVGPLLNVAHSRRETHSFILTLGTDNFVRRWDVRNAGSVLKSCNMLFKASDKPVYCVSLSKDDKIIATGGADKQIKLWNNKGTCSHVLKGHKSAVTAVCFHPNAPVIASGAADGSVRLWNTKSGNVLTVAAGASNNVTCLQFIQEGQLLIAGCHDGGVHAWSFENTNCTAVTYLGSQIAHNDRITIICDTTFASEKALLTSAGDGQVSLWRDCLSVNMERQRAAKRSKKEDAENVAIWLRNEEFGRVLEAAVKWKSPQTLQALVEALLTSTVTFNLSTYIKENNVDIPTLLLLAVHFCKKQATLHVAHWMCDAIIDAVPISSLKEIDGFKEFSRAFVTRSTSQIARWETLNEKSFLLDLVGHCGQLPLTF